MISLIIVIVIYIVWGIISVINLIKKGWNSLYMGYFLFFIMTAAVLSYKLCMSAVQYVYEILNK